MRQPPCGTSGTSASAGPIACDTRLHTGRAHATDERPAATVARNTPRPIRRAGCPGPSPVSIGVSLIVVSAEHAGPAAHHYAHGSAAVALKSSYANPARRFGRPTR